MFLEHIENNGRQKQQYFLRTAFIFKARKTVCALKKRKEKHSSNSNLCWWGCEGVQRYVQSSYKEHGAIFYSYMFYIH